MLPPPPRSTLFPYTTLFRSIRFCLDKTFLDQARQWDPVIRIDGIEPAQLAETSVAPNSVGYLQDRKSTRLNSSHLGISYAVFCLKKKTKITEATTQKYEATR